MSRAAIFLLILTISLILSKKSYAQYYNIIQSNESYDILSQPKSFQNDTSIILNFKLNLFGQEFNFINVSDEIFLDNGDYQLLVKPFGTKNGLVDRNYINDDSVLTQFASKRAYKIDGNIGSRILKFEFTNFKIKNSDPNDSITFQVWFYENTDRLDFRYSAINIETNQVYSPDSLRIGLSLSNPNGTTKINYFVTGPLNQLYLNPYRVAMTDEPVENTVISFRKGYSGIEDNELNFDFYPNPSQESITVELRSEEDFEIEIMTLSGQTIQKDSIHDYKTIDVSSISPGIYFLLIKSETGIVQRKFNKL